ncbi:hypothetical protein OF83DRAFT_826462 [Amylostereum chailletii]|nr:hypothetical protein OF83DRAFT_826462 [Amylostereum chailletii]
MAVHQIPLDRDSLYIKIESIHTEGMYHWSLVFVDAAGTARQYQWGAPPRPPNGQRRAPMPPEVFTSGPVAARLLLGCFKLGAYIGGLSHSVLEEVGANTFQSYDTVQENRARGLSSGSWVATVLTKLQESGRYSEGAVSLQAIEDQIKKISEDADLRRLQAFLAGTPYRMVITTV